MDHIRQYRRWTGGDMEMPAAYCGMSYVLFRTDRPDFPILGSRCPDPSWMAVGRSFLEALSLDDETVSMMVRNDPHPLPTFIESSVGIGLLLKSYDRFAGIGLYLHVHESPVALSRLIRGGTLYSSFDGGYAIGSSVADRGAPCRRDERGYAVLQKAWAEVRYRREKGGLLPLCGTNRVYVTDLLAALDDLAAFAGCRAMVTLGVWQCDKEVRELPSQINCYVPKLLEALLLYVFTEAYSLSVDGVVHGRVDVTGEGEHLLLRLAYDVEPKCLSSVAYGGATEARRHLDVVANLGGLILQAEVLHPSRKERQAGVLPRVCTYLEWLVDPTVLPSSDLKTDLRQLSEWSGYPRP